MNKIASPQDLQGELHEIHAYCGNPQPSRAVVAEKLRGLADRVAAKTWTLMVRNEALKSGNWEGTYESEQAAIESAKLKAKRARKYVEYTVCEGDPKNPGKDTQHVFRGTL